MRPQKESSPHELYLRAASAAKPMAPLKLYANVIGKFMVERQLGEKVTDKVRQQTMVAKQQHLERQAILLDQPPIPVSGTKHSKRKIPGSGTVVKKTPLSEHLRVPSSSSRKVSPIPQNTPSSKANADVRRRLVHCLAMSPRLSEEAVKMVGGAIISTPARDGLLALLEEVGLTLPVYTPYSYPSTPRLPSSNLQIEATSPLARGCSNLKLGPKSGLLNGQNSPNKNE